MTTARRSSPPPLRSSAEQRREDPGNSADTTPAESPDTRDEPDAAGSTDDIKAKFRAALKHKEHHDGPDIAGGGKAKGQESTHGPVPTKREFRRKTG